MGEAQQSESAGPVKAKAVLVDPETMTALWLNEAAQHAAGDDRDWIGAHVAEAVPMAEILGLPAALRAAAETGEPQHVRRSLVATARGGLAVVASVYRLPAGQLLVIIDEDYQLTAKGTAGGTSARGRRPRG